MKWFLITWLVSGGLGLSITPMPSEKVCHRAAEVIHDYIENTGETSKVFVKCFSVKS